MGSSINNGMLRELRMQHSLTQEELAIAADLSTRTVQRAENGEPASFETLKALAAVLNVDASSLRQPHSEFLRTLVGGAVQHLPRITDGLAALRVVRGADSYLFHHRLRTSDAGLALVAEMLEHLQEIGELDDIPETQWVDLGREASEHLQQLDRCGLRLFGEQTLATRIFPRSRAARANLSVAMIVITRGPDGIVSEAEVEEFARAAKNSE